MCTVSEMKARVEGVLDTVLSLAGECMTEKAVEIVGLVQDQMYEEGIDGDGIALAPYREIAYSRLKFSMRGRSITDLTLTGAFREAMFLEVDGETYFISSKDDKTPELEAKYGEAIFHLTADNKQQAWYYIEPLFAEKLKAQLQL